MPTELFDVKQVCKILGLSERTLFRYIKDKELTGMKLGREWRFEQKDIDAFLMRRREKSMEETK